MEGVPGERHKAAALAHHSQNWVPGAPGRARRSCRRKSWCCAGRRCSRPWCSLPALCPRDWRGAGSPGRSGAAARRSAASPGAAAPLPAQGGGRGRGGVEEGLRGLNQAGGPQRNGGGGGSYLEVGEVVFQQGLGVADVLSRPHKDEGHHALQRGGGKMAARPLCPRSGGSSWGGGGGAKAALQAEVRLHRLRRRWKKHRGGDGDAGGQEESQAQRGRGAPGSAGHPRQPKER